MKPSRGPVTEADRALFRSSVGPVEPVPGGPAPLPRGPRPPPEPRSRVSDERQVLEDMMSEAVDPAEWDHGEILSHCRPGLQHNVLRKLRRGQYRVGAVLDLHGMTVTSARQALGGFLQHARRERITCVRIIHGKGNRSAHRGPVLKRKVAHWLRQREQVLAFCSARSVDGGSGAVYVLLAREP